MKRRIPKYSLHKATGQSRVRLNGKTHYLGKYDSPESHRKYDELIAKWLTGEKLTTPEALTVSRLCVKYIEEHAKPYYRKNSRQTSELCVIQGALRRLTKLYGRCRAVDFGPIKLKAVRQAMVEAGIVRTSINRKIGRIRRMFKWGVENELVPVNVHASLVTVSGLRHERSEAKESDPILPIPREDIDAVKPHVSRQVWAMIQVQLATGMRLGEVRQMRIADIDMGVEPWETRPEEHKTQHHGRQRMIFIGPIAREIIRPFLKADPDRHLFSPAEARREFDTARRDNRQTPMPPVRPAGLGKWPQSMHRDSATQSLATLGQFKTRARKPECQSGRRIGFDTVQPRICGSNSTSIRSARFWGMPRDSRRKSTPNWTTKKPGR